LSGVTLPNAESAQALRCRLKENNIDARPFWKAIHLQPMFLSSSATAQPVSSEIWSRIVTLPCSTGIIEAELEKVVETIRKTLL
jgi:dTDP-4-amino-4,6-dideoxygalactose transaminase